MAEKMERMVADYHHEMSKRLTKYQTLRDLDMFVLDNSIRESTVGQLRGHTLESKWAIYDEVKKCGFKDRVVAAFSHMTRVDDVFVKQLKERGEDPEGMWAFSELTDGIKDKVPDTETVPVGIRKMKAAGLYCAIFEMDLGDAVYDFERFSIDEMCALMKKWIYWCHENLGPKTRTMISFRDTPDVMPEHTDRAFHVVTFLANLPIDRRPLGFIFEEPGGRALPEECGLWVKYFRKIMDDYNWKGHLLIHVHEKFGYGDATALQVLMDGANGVWCSVCTEGAAIGNASSCVTLLNLIRMGNKKVLEKYNCTYLRKAAINVTQITTGHPPHAKQPVYGARAVDLVFDLSSDEFDLASFFGERAPVRITSLASPEMIRHHLLDLFGEDEQFTLDMTYKMRELILEDLRSGRREEYTSMVGLALLLDRAGGKLDERMRDAIDNYEIHNTHGKYLLAEVRKIWDEWDLKDEVQGDEMLQYDSFYNGFMAAYFSSFRCDDTKKALQAIDMDSDGMVDWNEFELYLKWAINQYPETETVEELLDITFRKGLIPAMQDEIIKAQ